MSEMRGVIEMIERCAPLANHAAVVLEGVSKRYDGGLSHDGLVEVDLCLQRGELPRHGTERLRKSTSEPDRRLDTPDAGRVLVGGQDLARLRTTRSDLHQPHRFRLPELSPAHVHCRGERHWR
jgi:hypothetical protein